MRAAVFHAPGDVRIEDVPDPRIDEPTDAIVRITHTAICGSDLWFYRGQEEYEAGWRTGHEPMGVVEEVGGEVRHVKPGDMVIAPFAISDGTRVLPEGSPDVLRARGLLGPRAGRRPGRGGACAPRRRHSRPDPGPGGGGREAAGSAVPAHRREGTGHHAALSAGVGRGDTCVVVGDGAVGLCAVLASKRLGAERIIAVGHHADRLELARAFGATDLVFSRGGDAVEEVKELTHGGADHVLECVGSASSMDTAILVARPGGTIGYVGVPPPGPEGHTHAQ